MRVIATFLACSFFAGTAGSIDGHQTLQKARIKSLRKDEGNIQQLHISVLSDCSLEALAKLMLMFSQPSACWVATGHTCVSRPGCKNVGLRSSGVAMNCELPEGPSQMISNAASSIKRARDAGKKRLYLDVIIPQTKQVMLEGESFWDQDDPIDPWPGGTKQQYPYAVDLVRQIMSIVQTTEDPEKLQSQVLDPLDVCGLMIAQGKSPADDIAVVILPGCEQLKNIDRVDRMCEDTRLMILFNPVFKRLEDFTWRDRSRAKKLIYDKGFEVGYSYSNFECYGRFCDLVGEWGPSGLEWQAYARNKDTGATIPLSDKNFLDRPSYNDLGDIISEKKIKR